VKNEDPLGGLAGPSTPEPRSGQQPPQQLRRRIPPTPTTVLLLAVIGAGYAAQLQLGKSESDLAWFRLGSLMPAAVLQGDWYRLGSYAFLHAGYVHLLVNAWALWALMRPIEASLGPFAAIGIFSGTAIAGGATSLAWTLAFGDPMQSAVGASGGLFGLFGAHCAIYLRMRKSLPAATRAQAARALVYNLAINVALAIGAAAGGLPLDNAAHVGGFLSGMALGAVASVPALLPRRSWHRPATVFFTLCAFALASMEGAAIARAVHPPPRILEADGAEATVPWYLVEPKYGIGVTADFQFEAHLASRPFGKLGAAKEIQIGSRAWLQERAMDEKGHPYLDLVEPRSGIAVRVFCLRHPCAEDQRDALAEEIASHARTTLPP